MFAAGQTEAGECKDLEAGSVHSRGMLEGKVASDVTVNVVKVTFVEVE